MNAIAQLKALNREQRAAVIASVLGWSLDAFDFFLLVFVLRSMAADFHTEVKDVSYALFLTLAFRPLGALIFGWLADRFGRRPVLMADILLFSALDVAVAFAPSLTVVLILRALFGIAMGGEWGVGSSLVMESIPPQSRGIVSGILQEGYALGYLLAAVVYGLFFDLIGWRGLFIVGALPAVLVLYIRMGVKESPAWVQNRHRQDRPGLLATFCRHWKMFLYVVALMTAFNFFSHGTQDLYPTFLQAQHKLSAHTVSAILIVANIGAILGGVCFGAWSQRLGRRRAIITAVAVSLPIIPFWAFASTPILLGLGAFLMQFAVQGAWGVIPAHLNELSPDAIRGTFPGFTYQIGNLLAAYNGVMQARIAADHGGNYALALVSVAAVMGIAIIVVTACGREARDADLARPPPEATTG